MTFQFLCPQGHLLQGEEAHMGMQCQCPQCGVAFIIPTITPAAAPAPSVAPAPAASNGSSLELVPIEDDDKPARHQPVRQEITELEVPSIELSALEAFDDGGRRGTELDIGELEDEAGESLLHIPCPNGHMLDVPAGMVGTRAMCPHCRAEFRLKRERSVEYQREQEIIDAKRAKFWFKLAIVAAGVVGVILVFMIIASFAT
jgi:hypothetical protein